MTEYIPTTWNDERDTTFFGITEALSADGFTSQIEKVLDDLLAAESWESMATRSVARDNRRHRDLVPVPVVVRRPAAS